MVVLVCLLATTIQAGKYQNFKVSTYIRAQDVARMDDEKFLKSTWETVSSQVDLDKIYLETHRDAFIVPEKTLTKVKKFFLSKGLEVGGGLLHRYTACVVCRIGSDALGELLGFQLVLQQVVGGDAEDLRQGDDPCEIGHCLSALPLGNGLAADVHLLCKLLLRHTQLLS